MNKRTILASAMAITMLGASFSALTLCGCNSKKASKQPLVTVAHNKVFEAKDILSLCSTWVGQVAGVVGMSEEYINTDGGTKKIVVTGNLFGKPADSAYATFADGSDIINKIFITTSAFTFDEAKEELTKIYGEPKKVDEAYIDFKAPPTTVRLSENDGKVSVVVY